MTAQAAHESPGEEFANLVTANVRAEASRRGMNQKDLAVALGWSHAAVHRRWHGMRRWQLEDLGAVAEVFGTTPQALCAAGPDNENAPAAYATGAKRARRDSNPQPSGWEFDGDHVAEVVPLPMVSEPGIDRDELATVHTLSPATMSSTVEPLEPPHAC